MRLLGCVLVILLVACATIAPDASRRESAGAQGKLPKNVVPSRYVIDLKPDLDTLTVSGTEVIDIDVREPTAQVVLNALDVSVDAASMQDEPGQPANITTDAAAQTATLGFARPLSVGAHKLQIRFTGRINRYGRGLFMVDYPAGGVRKRMLATHFEPADARRMFPSWDEPAFKANFELSVTVPSAFTAVSNMPAVRDEPAGAARRISFAATPKMSSYLVVLVAGELERLSREFDGVSVGVVTARGKRTQGRYALDSAIQLLAYYNDYFGLRYPLPKLDLIAVPGGINGAMENWGGITFLESNLLFDTRSTPPAARRSIFSIIAHEMAHLWFGDLVTMAWWDDLWLNEGFASWMQIKATERLHPDWQPWLNGGGKPFAMAADARRTSHPIQQSVAEESEALAAFDAITYSKAQAILRMLEHYLGEDAFRTGIRAYLRGNAYGNATTSELWRALRESSGKPVEDIAVPYTAQPGVPLVSVRSDCSVGGQRMVLEQQRFTLHDPTASAQRWPVPLVFGPIDAGAAARSLLLEGRAEVSAGSCGDPVKFNLGDVGYYRVQYDEASWKALARSVPSIDMADRINLLADTWALVEAGRVPPARYFDLVEALPDDSGRVAWQQVGRAFVRIDFLQRGLPGRAAFQAYARKRLRRVFERVGWNARQGESGDIALLRPELVRTLGGLGDPDIIAEAKRRFFAFVKNPQSLNLGLRGAVANVTGRSADRAAYSELLALARKSTSFEERSRYYLALAGARDAVLARETLELALTDELPPNLASGVIMGVASAGEQPELAWEFVRSHLESLAGRLGPNFRRTFASGLMSQFSDAQRAKELAGFKPANETPGARILAERAQESILINAESREHQLPAVDAWVRDRARPASNIKGFDIAGHHATEQVHPSR